MTAATATGIAEAFAELRESFGVPISFAGETVSAIVDETEFGRELSNGGFSDDAEVRCKVLLSDLTFTPTQGDGTTKPTAAVYKSTAFKVAKAAIQPGALVGEFTLRPSRR